MRLYNNYWCCYCYKGSVILRLFTLLTLVAVCVSNPTYNCYEFTDGGTDSYATIIPTGDIVTEVGVSYEALCLGNPDLVNADKMYFQTTGSNPRILPHQVVNSSTIQLQITPNKTEEYNIKCMSKDREISMCDRKVYIGYKPQDVENFNCVSMNWESLNCSWDVPDNPVKVKYDNITYILRDYNERDCPNRGNGKANWCFWDHIYFNHIRRNWTVIIKAKNKLVNDYVEFRHDFDVYTTVIPNKASRFGVKVLGPRSVSLSWRYPHPMDNFVNGKVRQEVKYRIHSVKNELVNSAWEGVNIWTETPIHFEFITYHKNISDLYPFVEYEFSIRLHTGTGPIKENMWSKPALVTIRTEATRPTSSPRSTLGMFEVEETKLHRDVYVSWQTVDPREENGPNFEYEVTAFDTTSQSPRLSMSTTRGYAKFFNLENDVTYRFEITPKNREGYPEDPDVKAVVVVPKKKEIIKTPDYFKVIAYPGNETTTYMLRWKLPKRQQGMENDPIRSVTLFWCKQTEYENRCQNKLSWEVVSEPNLNVKNITRDDTTSRFLFGISVNTHNSSSGIKWSGCIASHGDKQPPLEEFNYTKISSREVTFKWDLTCKAEAAQPTAFNISYCITLPNARDCYGDEEYVIADGESTVEYTVRNLHPYRHYLFNIATISDLGLGMWSPSVHVMTKATKPSGPPQNVKVISKGQDWIYLAWDPPLESEQNGEIVGYEIKYRVKGSLTLSEMKEKGLQYNYTNLDPFTTYNFKIFPCTQVNQEPECGVEAATIDVKTRIGVPGKIDSFEHESKWLKWDHDECNGPSCFYEIHYTVNGTKKSYTTPISHKVVTLEELNIDCSVEQGEIPMSLRAVSKDEEGHRLEGPVREKNIMCKSEGSYVILVTFLNTTKFTSNVNLVEISEGGFRGTASSYPQSPRLHPVVSAGMGEETITASLAHKPIISILLSFLATPNQRDTNHHNQPLTDRDNERVSTTNDRRTGESSHSLFSNQGKSLHEQAGTLLTNSRPTTTFTGRNIEVFTAVQMAHQDIQSQAEVSNNLELGLLEQGSNLDDSEIQQGSDLHGEVEDLSTDSHGSSSSRQPPVFVDEQESKREAEETDFQRPEEDFPVNSHGTHLPLSLYQNESNREAEQTDFQRPEEDLSSNSHGTHSALDSNQNESTSNRETQGTDMQRPEEEGSTNADQPSIIVDQSGHGVNKQKGTRHSKESRMPRLIELLKDKKVDASIKATNESFELNIKWQVNFLELLQAINLSTLNLSEAGSDAESVVSGNALEHSNSSSNTDSDFHRSDILTSRDSILDKNSGRETVYENIFEEDEDSLGDSRRSDKLVMEHFNPRNTSDTFSNITSEGDIDEVIHPDDTKDSQT